VGWRKQTVAKKSVFCKFQYTKDPLPVYAGSGSLYKKAVDNRKTIIEKTDPVK